MQLSLGFARLGAALGWTALALAWAGSGCGRAPAPSRAEVSLHAGYYQDTDHVSVWSPSVRARVPLARRVTASAGYGVDITSAASVDVVASASRFVEPRHQGTVGGSLALDERNTLGASGRLSSEPDYTSRGLNLTFDHESPSRSRAVHLELRGRLDQAGPGYVLSHEEDLTTGTALATLTQVLDPRTVLRVGWQGDVLSGFQSNVYRYVTVNGGSYPEEVPDFRARTGVLARVQRSLFPRLAVYAEGGVTADTWGVWSFAGELGARWELTPWATLDLRQRVQRQTAASFYQGRYDALTVYRTRDRLLGGMRVFWPQVSLRARWPGSGAPWDWELGLSAGYLSQAFDDYALISSRSAGVFELWATRRF